jgi:hypothetical protein
MNAHNGRVNHLHGAQLFGEQHPQAAAQVDTPATYRGYSYLVGENGVVLKLKEGRLQHFSSEDEAVAYVDSIADGDRWSSGALVAAPVLGLWLANTIPPEALSAVNITNVFVLPLCRPLRPQEEWLD